METATMHVIKNKLKSLQNKIDTLEQQNREANARADNAEEEVGKLQKKIQTLENELLAANTKLEEKEKNL